jgi:hypothetical protein
VTARGRLGKGLIVNDFAFSVNRMLTCDCNAD